jgi:hypothetical protein
MKVKDLIECLSTLNPESDVILQKDSEGNFYSPLRGADADCVYMPDTTYSGNVYSMDWSADDACLDDDQWEKIKAKPRCVVLYPIN